MAQNEFPIERINATLDTIMSASLRINTAADKATAILNDVETKLARATPGVSAVGKTIGAGTHTLDDDERTVKTTEISICYDKIDGRWQLGVAVGYFDPDGYGGEDYTCVSISPLASCDRTTRVKAVAALPDLLEDIAKEMDKIVEEAENVPASAEVENVPGSLGVKEILAGQND